MSTSIRRNNGRSGAPGMQAGAADPVKTISRPEKARIAAGIILPLLAAGAVFANMACETECTYLYGALFGVDLHHLGIGLAAALLLLGLPFQRPSFKAFSDHARAWLLCMTVGGGVVLLYFQAVNRIFCLFCLVYGALIFALFLLNVNRTSRPACAVFLAAGLLLFVFFFEGSAVPVFQF